MGYRGQAAQTEKAQIRQVEGFGRQIFERKGAAMIIGSPVRELWSRNPSGKHIPAHKEFDGCCIDGGRFPTSSPEFSQFLRQVDGATVFDDHGGKLLQEGEIGR